MHTKNRHDKVFYIHKKSYFCIDCNGEFIGKEVNHSKVRSFVTGSTEVNSIRRK
jgi:hypothetical protein